MRLITYLFVLHILYASYPFYDLSYFAMAEGPFTGQNSHYYYFEIGMNSSFFQSSSK